MPSRKIQTCASTILTRRDAAPILSALRREGLFPKLVGGIQKRGHSHHDIDIIVPFRAEGEVEGPMDYPEYAKYSHVMRSLGFESTSEGTFDTAEGITEVEEWRRGCIIVDIYPQAQEPGIDFPLKGQPKAIFISEKPEE